MGLTLVGSNAVVVARQFNPSVLSQIWLVETGILQTTDFGGEFAFTPLFSQVTTKDFTLLVIPERLQFVPTVDENRQRAFIIEKVGAIVKALPHTPYTAMGMNFT